MPGNEYDAFHELQDSGGGDRVIQPGATGGSGGDGIYGDIRTELGRTREDIAQVQPRIMESFDRSTEIERRRQSAMNPLYRQTQALLNQARPTPPPEPQPPRPAPSTDFSQEMQNWVQWATVLGAIGSMFSRRSSIAALNAFSGAINGFRQGNQQQIDNSLRVWERESQLAIQHEQQLLARYQAILQDRSLSVEEMRLALMTEAQRWGAMADFETLQRNGLTAFVQGLRQHENILSRALASMENQEMRMQYRMAQIQSHLARGGNITEGSAGWWEWFFAQPLEMRRVIWARLQQRWPTQVGANPPNPNEMPTLERDRQNPFAGSPFAGPGQGGFTSPRP